MEEVEGGSLLVGEFSEGLAKTGFVVGGELEKLAGFSEVLLGQGEVFDLGKKVLIRRNHVEIGAPGKSHAGVSDIAGELYEFTSRNHETDLSLGLLVLFGDGGCFGCVRVVWRGVNDGGHGHS